MVWVFIYFQQLFTRPLNETGNYMRLTFITWSFRSKIFGWWILIAADNAYVADLLDTVHHEMDSMVCSHHVYKSVWFSVIGEQLVPEKEPANQSTRWICSGCDKGFSDSVPHYVEKFIHTSRGIFYYMKGLCHPLSNVCHITGRRRKGKGLEVLCKYNYYYGSTKTWRLFKTQRLFLL